MSEQCSDGQAGDGYAKCLLIALCIAVVVVLFLFFGLKITSEARDSYRSALFQWAKRADTAAVQTATDDCTRQQPSDITGCLAKWLVDQAPGTGDK